MLKLIYFDNENDRLLHFKNCDNPLNYVDKQSMKCFAFHFCFTFCIQIGNPYTSSDLKIRQV